MVASKKERITIRQLCVSAERLRPGHDDEASPVDVDDSCAVAKAYSNLILVPTDPDLREIMILDMARYLLEFVCDLSSSASHSTTDDRKGCYSTLMDGV